MARLSGSPDRLIILDENMSHKGTKETDDSTDNHHRKHAEFGLYRFEGSRTQESPCLRQCSRSTVEGASDLSFVVALGSGLVLKVYEYLRWRDLRRIDL